MMNEFYNCLCSIQKVKITDSGITEFYCGTAEEIPDDLKTLKITLIITVDDYLWIIVRK